MISTREIMEFYANSWINHAFQMLKNSTKILNESFQIKIRDDSWLFTTYTYCILLSFLTIHNLLLVVNRLLVNCTQKSIDKIFA